MTFSKEQETLDNNKNVVIFHPLHEIDSYTGEALRNEIFSEITENDAVIINFSRVVYLNSSGLRELIQILRGVKDARKPLYLTNVSNDVLVIFSHTNLDKLFKIFPTDEEAKSQISQ